VSRFLWSQLHRIGPGHPLGRDPSRTIDADQIATPGGGSGRQTELANLAGGGVATFKLSGGAGAVGVCLRLRRPVQTLC